MRPIQPTVPTDSHRLFAADSTGTVRWRFKSMVEPGCFALEGTSNEIGGLSAVPVRLPDGYLIAVNQDSYPFGTGNDMGVARFDLHGVRRRHWVSHEPGFDYLDWIETAPDGSYLCVGSIFNRGQVNGSYWGEDTWIVRLSARGARLADYTVGVDGDNETVQLIRPTLDDGYVLAGTWNPSIATRPPGSPVNDRGQVTKLDSAMRVQWRYVLAGYDNGGQGPNCTFYEVQPLTDGTYVAFGKRQETYGNREAIVVGISATGQQLWLQTYRVNAPPQPDLVQQGEFSRAVFEADGSVVLFGYARWTNALIPNWRWQDRLVKLTGLAPAWHPDLCARPPAPPVGHLTANPAPLVYTFAADTTVSAGPRYALPSYYVWYWGDGTPADTGRVAEHVFATGIPATGQVRLCVTNNLFCTTCAPLTPLAVAPAAAAPPALTVWPNPAADGRFRVRPGRPGATLIVSDALGRVLWAGPATAPPETLLDLNAQPPGVYILGATWPDGSRTTRRLVR